MVFLSLPPSDRVLAELIINRAHSNLQEEERARLRAIEVAVQNGTAKAWG